MKEVSTTGIDIAKRVYQAHGINKEGEAIIRRKLRRSKGMNFPKGFLLA